MVIIWMAMHARTDKKYDTEKLRQKELSSNKAVEEIVIAAEKLKYELFSIGPSNISLMKIEPNGKGDILLMTVFGTSEEILKIQLEEKLKKLLK